MYGKKRSEDFAQAAATGVIHHAALEEAAKGNDPTIHPYPVKLEPTFQLFDPSQTYRRTALKKCERTRIPKQWHVRDLQIPTLDIFEWKTANALTTSLASITNVATFEIVGNKDGAQLSIGTEQEAHLGGLAQHWQAIYPTLTTSAIDDPLAWFGAAARRYRLLDLYPAGPYHHSMHSPPSISPLAHVLKAFSTVPTTGRACYQVLYQPVRADWHRNIRSLTYAEQALGERSPWGKATRTVGKDARCPLFVVRVRCWWTGDARTAVAFRSLPGSFIYDGKPMLARDEADFARVLPSDGVDGI